MYNNIDLHGLKSRISKALSGTLPGEDAHRKMTPERRNENLFEHKHTAAVLLSLYIEDDDLKIPLILRAEDGYAHSGQVGLPGGRIESGETVEQAALREAYEETGLNPENVKLLGRLTTLRIPVSHYLVHPVVGFLDEIPKWNPDPREVQYVFSIGLSDLMKPKNRLVERWTFSSGEREIPFFLIQGKKIWGATSMILNEFVEVSKKVRK